MSRAVGMTLVSVTGFLSTGVQAASVNIDFRGIRMRHYLTAAIFMIWVLPAGAVPVTWTLDNVVISGGPTTAALTGSFDYDADTDAYSNVFISSYYELFNDGQTNYTYPLDNDNSPTHYESSTSEPCGVYLCDMVLQLNFVSPLSNAGGVIEITGTERVKYDAGFGPISYYRVIESGAVSAVPIPAAVWLFGSALAALGWIRKRRDI